MSETSAQWYARVQAAIADGGLRNSDFTQWDVFPWQPDWSVKELEPPVLPEPQRRGHDGVDCHSCEVGRTLAGAAWADDLFHLTIARESSLPFAAFLMPRRHADLATLTRQEAARQGELLAAIERAAAATTCCTRIQVARWGDGGEHMHWWLYARPEGSTQLRGSFLMVWDDLLPLRPAADIAADARLFVDALVADVGGRALLD